MESLREDIQQVLNEVSQVVVGKDEIIKKVLTAILAKGHILLEDVPGVGKTTLAIAISRAMELTQKRIQFTPDVLPSDVVGYTMLQPGSHEEIFKPGAVMCNLLLADEINRTSSKTQSALLEVMEEGKVTVDQVTRMVPNPFTVIATQNPSGSIGTQMLPDSQLDRFMIKLNMGYPDLRSEVNMLKNRQNNQPLEKVSMIVTREKLLQMQEEVEQIYIQESLYDYMVWLIQATRNNPYIEQGVSPRGTLALMKMAKATAYVYDRDYVTPDDVQEVFQDVAGHRIFLSSKAKLNHMSVSTLLQDIVRQQKAPKVTR